MDDESERRRAAGRFAINSLRLSGFILGNEILDDFERFVIGEITTAQMRENVLLRYDLTKK